MVIGQWVDDVTVRVAMVHSMSCSRLAEQCVYLVII